MGGRGSGPPLYPTSRRADTQAQREFEDQQSAPPWGTLGLLRPQWGWKWGTGAWPSSAQRRQQGLGSRCRPALTPLHPQSLGTGRAPWMVTQKPGCQQLLPGTAHTGLHCFRQESLAATSKAGICVLSAHGLTSLGLETIPAARIPVATISHHPGIRDKATVEGGERGRVQAWVCQQREDAHPSGPLR